MFFHNLFVIFGFYVTLCFFIFFIFFYFICNICNVKKTEKWGRGVNCEEEIREKNEMGEGGCMCVVGEKKKERQEIGRAHV